MSRESGAEAVAELNHEHHIEYVRRIDELRARHPAHAALITSMADRSLELFEPGIDDEPRRIAEEIELAIKELEAQERAKAEGMKA